MSDGPGIWEPLGSPVPADEACKASKASPKLKHKTKFRALSINAVTEVTEATSQPFTVRLR